MNTKSAAEQIADLKLKFETDVQDLLIQATKDFYKALEIAAAAYKGIPEASRQDIYDGDEVKAVVQSLGLYTSGPRKGSKKGKKAAAPAGDTTESKTSNAKITGDMILEFLAGGKKNQSEITEHFKSTTVTIRAKLDKLKADGNIEEVKEGTSKYYSKV